MTGDGLSPGEAVSRLWLVDRHGLLTDDMADLAGFQRRYARPAAAVASWARDPELGGVSLDEVVRRVHPTILIGTSTRGGAFTEAIVREMAAQVARPVILPMSNPTELAEANPHDLIRWSGGRALVATGGPFPPFTYERVTYAVGQANNALIFPGLGLGVIAARATRVTDHMLLAAAHAISALVHASAPGASLLPQVEDLRPTSAAVAVAVARAAIEDGVAPPSADDLEQKVRSLMWHPSYRPIRAA
jgi:malate dehydrogenase (oxaloacetate-decarboxylating)